MDWSESRNAITPCAKCGASVEIINEPASNAIILTGYRPYCPKCKEKAMRREFVADKRVVLEW
jgi:hypothetical protein